MPEMISLCIAALPSIKTLFVSSFLYKPPLCLFIMNPVSFADKLFGLLNLLKMQARKRTDERMKDRRWFKVQSYISEGEVKTLVERVVKEEERESERGFGVWLNLNLRDWVSCSFRWMPTEKTENSAPEWLNLTLPSFLGVSDPVSTHTGAVQSLFFSAFTFPLGQTGQIKPLDSFCFTETLFNQSKPTITSTFIQTLYTDDNAAAENICFLKQGSLHQRTLPAWQQVHWNDQW